MDATGSMATILFMAERESTTSSKTGTLPPGKGGKSVAAELGRVSVCWCGAGAAGREKGSEEREGQRRADEACVPALGHDREPAGVAVREDRGHLRGAAGGFRLFLAAGRRWAAAPRCTCAVVVGRRATELSP